LYQVPDFKIGNYSFAQVLDYLPGFGLDENWNIVKLILMIVSVLLGILIAMVIVRINRLMGTKINLAKELLPPQPATSGSNARWDEIEKHINSTREAEWKFAVIEADKLVDELLRGAGFPGDTMGDRLMNIQPGQLTTLQNLWEAHKIRNRLAHDINYFLRYTEAKRAVGLYEKTLKELQAL
ncbi:MAG: hypothetical protein UU70_C0028G0006, partial [Candidatus Yanofskybacteria bacterium GW2011_GWA1_41_6]